MEDKKVTLEEVHTTLTDYIKSDVAWKERAEPVIKAGISLQGAWKFFGWAVGFAIGLTAIIGAAKYVWVFIMDFSKPKI